MPDDSHVYLIVIFLQCAKISGKQAHRHDHVELQASHSPSDRLSDRSANHSYHLVTNTVLIV